MRVSLYHDNCLDGLSGLANGRVDLIVTSPPYNLGKNYERRVDLNVYLHDMEPILDELVRALAPTGSLCWQVGNYVHHGAVTPLDILFYPLFIQRGLTLRNRIVWHFNHGLHASKRFSGRYETILWFTKSEPYYFNLDSVRVPAKYPGKTHVKGPKAGQPSGNPLGCNPSDYWAVLERDWEAGVWEIPNVKANHPEKTAHPCQFPIELAERCVLALSPPGGLVLDPFAGAGSTLLAAAMHGRRALGYETQASYVEIARERLARLEAGTLPYRPLGKPVYQPSGREKVAQRPAQWDQEGA